jgi:hypothetical protein
LAYKEPVLGKRTFNVKTRAKEREKAKYEFKRREEKSNEEIAYRKEQIFENYKECSICKEGFTST